MRQCLDSVVKQSLREIEIICVDDGSTDDSLSILREYEAGDSRIRVLTQSNINAGAARNHGIDVARGVWLSFLDADDFFEPEMLEHACAYACDKEAEILVYRCDNYITDEDCYTSRPNSIEAAWIPEVQPFPGTAVRGNLFLAFVGWAWDKLFLREYVLKNGLRFQEQRTTNDLYFTYFALAKAQRIVTMDDVFAHHRIQLNTSLEATREKSWDCFYKALLALREGLQREGLFARFEQDFVNYAVSFSLWNLSSLTWPQQEVLFYLLKHVWLKELDVTEHDATYFEDQIQYREICQVLYGEYAVMFPKGGAGQYKEEIAALHESVLHGQEELARIREDNAALYVSVSFRVGRAITWLPRMVRDGMRRLLTCLEMIKKKD